MKQGMRQALFRLITKLQQQEKELFTFYFTFYQQQQKQQVGKRLFRTSTRIMSFTRITNSARITSLTPTANARTVATL